MEKTFQQKVNERVEVYRTDMSNERNLTFLRQLLISLASNPKMIIKEDNEKTAARIVQLAWEIIDYAATLKAELEVTIEEEE